MTRSHQEGEALLAYVYRFLRGSSHYAYNVGGLLKDAYRFPLRVTNPHVLAILALFLVLNQAWV